MVFSVKFKKLILKWHIFNKFSKTILRPVKDAVKLIPFDMRVYIKMFYSMIIEVVTEFFQNWKTLKNHENFSENMVEKLKSDLTSLWKTDHFPKIYICSEGGSFALSSCGKNSMSILFKKKIDFLWRGRGEIPLSQ